MCSPKRPTGMRAFQSASISAFGTRRCQAPSVGKGPGAMALSRMPWRPHSAARLRVMASTPALAMAEGTT